MTETFSVSRDEVMSGEYFSHANEPMLTINPVRKIIYINAIGLKRLPDMDYVLLLISHEDKRLSIYPCDSGEQHAVRLRSGGKSRNKPRQVRCREEFWDNILLLTGWKNDSRYRLIGYIAKGGIDTIIAFDLTSAEVFASGERVADIPKNVQGYFGRTFEELRNNPLIKRAEQDIGLQLGGTEDELGYEN